MKMGAIQQGWGLSQPTVGSWSQGTYLQRPKLSRCFFAAKISVACKAVQSEAGNAVSLATERDQVAGAEAALLEALLAIQGRGRDTSAKQLQSDLIQATSLFDTGTSQEVGEAVKVLEELKGVPNALSFGKEPTLHISVQTGSPLLDGTWELVYTTRPGTASPIQRTFVGVDAFKVFQELSVVSTDQKRVSNIVRFSEKIGELKVEAAASVKDDRRILFQFDKAAFSFKCLPFKVPYPVPFRLLGDKAKGWIDITYLSPSGAMRIARGNKGTTFILQRSLDARQQLLQTMSAGDNVEEAIEKFLAEHSEEVDLAILGGRWRNIWSSQAADANWLQRSSTRLTNWQIIRPEDGVLENLVDVFPGIKLRAEGSTVSVATSKQRRGVQISKVTIDIGSLRIPLGISGEGYLDILYLDNKLRISRGNKGSLFVHIRESDT